MEQKSNVWAIIITIVITAIIAGGGVYLWQNKDLWQTETPKTDETAKVYQSSPTDMSEPLLYSTKGVDVQFSKKEETFNYTLEKLKSMAEECGTTYEPGYFEKLVEDFKDTPKIEYKFKYVGASQGSDTFVATLLWNSREYQNLDEVKKDFDQCYAGGDMYPISMNPKWLLFVNSCGTGFSDGSGDPIGCQAVKDVLDPTLKLNAKNLEEPEVSEEETQRVTDAIIKYEEEFQKEKALEVGLELPSGVEWITYADKDISFLYPKTFLGTDYEETFDKNYGGTTRQQWEVTREDNTIYIRPNFESPAAEFGATYEIKILKDKWEAETEWTKSAQLHQGAESQWGEKAKNINNSNYYYIGVLRNLDFGLGNIFDIYTMIPGGIDELGQSEEPNKKHFFVYASPDTYKFYVEEVLIPSIKAK